MYSKPPPSSQTGQVLAITLLNNTNLDDATLVNNKSDLIKYAKTRKAKEANSHASSKIIEIPALTPFMIAAKDLVESGSGVSGSPQGYTKETAQPFQKGHRRHMFSLTRSFRTTSVYEIRKEYPRNASSRR